MLNRKRNIDLLVIHFAMKRNLVTKKWREVRYCGKLIQSLRAVCCKNRLRVCKIEKSDFLKIGQNKGFGEVVLTI